MTELPSRPELTIRACTGVRAKLPSVRVPRDSKRRAAGRLNLLGFLKSYFPYLRQMNPCQAAFTRELEGLIMSGAPLKQLKALAAPRGGGKSTICQLAILWAAIYGHVRFALVLAANGDKAKERLGSIQEYVVRNELLADDFPEICQFVRDFGGDPRRAPPGYPWTTNEMRLANGIWIVSTGIDGAIAGALRGDSRPDLIVLDDVEAGTDVASEAESKKLRARIQEALALPPQSGTSTVIFICTLKAPDCLSAELTDANSNPAWRGERHRALVRPPVREDMWGAFMGILRPSARLGRVEQVKDAVLPESIAPEDVAEALEFPADAFIELRPEHQRAYAFYVANRSAMDEGAEVLAAASLPLLRIYEERAVQGEKYFRCELQNDPPPPEDRLQALQLADLQKRTVPTLPQQAVPAWADSVLVTCDVGLRSIHWEASAWSFDREASVVIDCGITSTGLGADGTWELAADASRSGLMERGVKQALDRIFTETRSVYTRIDTGHVMIPFGAVDMGGGTGRREIEEGDSAWSRVVISWCGARRGQWWAVKGSGTWSEALRKLAGEGNWTWNERGFAVMHTDYYKTRLYDALQAPELFEMRVSASGGMLPAVGSRAFHAAIPDAYLRHMMSEERDAKGRWVQVAKRNHWWDTAYMSFALADLMRRGRARAKVKRKYGVVGKAFQVE